MAKNEFNQSSNQNTKDTHLNHVCVTLHRIFQAQLNLNNGLDWDFDMSEDSSDSDEDVS